MPVFKATIFLGAFLLFWIQPLMARFLLPLYGGVPEVWSACLLFFQAALLIGYAWAYWLVRWCSPMQQLIGQAIIGTAAIASVFTGVHEWNPSGLSEYPAGEILVSLTLRIGLPCLLLASTTPLIQSWCAARHPDRNPYHLYSLSNLGSLLALLMFPLLLEPEFSRAQQFRGWSFAFVVFAFGIIVSGLHQPPRIDPARDSSANSKPVTVTRGQRAMWIALPFCSSVLLLGFTNRITREIAVVPLLWIVPLLLYLLAWIFAFERHGWHDRISLRKWLPWILAVTLMFSLISLLSIRPGLIWQTSFYCAVLFLLSWFCHSEVYRLRPDERQLAGYYLGLAAGGALGGVFVTFLAPRVFSGYGEVPFGLWFCAMLAAFLYQRDIARRPTTPDTMRRSGYAWAGLIGYAVLLMTLAQAEFPGSIDQGRNFFGTWSIRQPPVKPGDSAYRTFMMSGTIHGLQFTSAQHENEPTTYYCPESGAGRVIRRMQSSGKPMRIGVVGLGIGTLAAYGRTNDVIRFYEINPQVISVANEQFSYLRRSSGRIETVPGDARQRMISEPPQSYDLLIIDAFNGSTIPHHLLTQEAFGIYSRHLKRDGRLLLHVTNKYLDLSRVIGPTAATLHYHSLLISWRADAQQWKVSGKRSSDWILVSRDLPAENRSGLDTATIRLLSREGRPWTDEHTAILPLLK